MMNTVHFIFRRDATPGAIQAWVQLTSATGSHDKGWFVLAWLLFR